MSSGTSVVSTRIRFRRDSNCEIEERETESKSKEGISSAALEHALSGEMKLIPMRTRIYSPAARGLKRSMTAASREAILPC